MRQVVQPIMPTGPPFGGVAFPIITELKADGGSSPNRGHGSAWRQPVAFHSSFRRPVSDAARPGGSQGGEMEPFALVNHAIDLLASHLPAAAEFAAHVGEDAAAHALYEAVAKKLRDQGESDALTDFVAHPDDKSLVKRLVRQAVRDDPAFAAELSEAVAAVHHPTVSSTSVNQIGNVAGRDFVGRDSIRTTSSSTTNNRKSSNAGLLAVGVAVVIAAILLVGMVGKAVLGGIESGGLNGDSTCADFLQSADQQQQAAAMKKIYLAKGKPHLAADPFIIQNTDYFCGNSPKTTLNHLADARHDS
jgi:hypothetical protein